MKLVYYPQSSLNDPSLEVTEFNTELHDLLDQMKETMYESKGVGLAAPQIGINKNIFVMDSSVKQGNKNKFVECINPVIKEISGSQQSYEGCLSFPGPFDYITRPQEIFFTYQDRYGSIIETVAEGYEATIVAHEIDHLKGKLFIDSLSRQTRRKLISKYNKGVNK
jgi:peptide deformylase